MGRWLQLGGSPGPWRDLPVASPAFQLRQRGKLAKPSVNSKDL